MNLAGQHIDLVVTVFSGFTQKRSSLTSGMVAIAHECDQLLCGVCNAQVHYHTWRTDVADAAAAALNFRRPGRDQVHCVISFSYGCDTATRYLRQLQLRGDCTVAEWWCVDPVRRWKPLPGVAAATGLGALSIPQVVERVVPFRQRNPRWQLGRAGGVFQPAGHAIVAESLHTTVEPWREMTCGHCFIDKEDDVRLGFLSVVSRQANSLRGESPPLVAAH